MALIKCTECGKEVSNGAGKCPHCGAKIKKSVGLVGIIFVALIGWAIFASVSQSEIKKREEESKSPAQIAAEEKQKALETKRYSAATVAAATIKRAMRDPESLKFESMRVNEDASIVCARYRARNGFGGMNGEFIVFVKNAGHQDAATWNKHCKAEMFDLLAMVE